jgi:hypothetical protein
MTRLTQEERRKTGRLWPSFLRRIATEPLTEEEMEHPKAGTLLKLLWQPLHFFVVSRPGEVMLTTFLLLMLWGTHGRIELLDAVWPKWRGPGIDLGARPSIIPGLVWDQELISFAVGFGLLVVIPILLIRFRYYQPLSDYGLALPAAGRRRLSLLVFAVLMGAGLPLFWAGSRDAGMRALYPLSGRLQGWDFVYYELASLLFFMTIEFTFRGYLLFGLLQTSASGDRRQGGPARLRQYAILVPMLAYTAWHLGKPIPELWGTPVWGFATGVAAVSTRSIWPIVLAHWLLNVYMDALIARPF